MLEIMRPMRASQTRLEENVRDVQYRMSTLAQQVGVVIASEMSRHASVSMRLDRLTDRSRAGRTSFPRPEPRRARSGAVRNLLQQVHEIVAPEWLAHY